MIELMQSENEVQTELNLQLMVQDTGKRSDSIFNFEELNEKEGRRTTCKSTHGLES